MQHKTWTINEVRDGEKTELVRGATHDEALRAIRFAMYGKADAFADTRVDPVHELPLAA
jgi:hypothetical protein